MKISQRCFTAKMSHLNDIEDAYLQDGLKISYLKDGAINEDRK